MNTKTPLIKVNIWEHLAAAHQIDAGLEDLATAYLMHLNAHLAHPVDQTEERILPFPKSYVEFPS